MQKDLLRLAERIVGRGLRSHFFQIMAHDFGGSLHIFRLTSEVDAIDSASPPYVEAGCDAVYQTCCLP